MVLEETREEARTLTLDASRWVAVSLLRPHLVDARVSAGVWNLLALTLVVRTA
jgi:hypothetical protein